MLAFAARNHKLVSKNRPLPRLRRGWALIRVRLAGICNTDIEILRGESAGKSMFLVRRMVSNQFAVFASADGRRIVHAGPSWGS